MILKTIIILLTLFFIGFVICNLLFKIKTWPRILPISLATGISTYLFFLNLSSYIIPLEKNYFIVLGSLFILSLFFALLKRDDFLMESIKLSGFNRVKIVGLILILLFFLVNATILVLAVNFDNIWHWPFTATLASGNFPPRHPYNPGFNIGYHYGYNLFSAVFVNLAQVFPSLALIIAQIILWFLLFCLVLIFFYDLTKRNIFWTGLASFLFYYSGGLKYILFFLPKPFFSFQPEYQISLRKNWIWYVYSNIHNPSFFLVINKVTLPAYLALFLVLILYRLNIRGSVKFIFYVIFFSIMALSYETLFLPFFLLFFLVLVVSNFFKKNYKALIILFFCALIIALIVLIQGGVITHNFLSKLDSTGHQNISFKIREQPAVPLTCAGLQCINIAPLSSEEGWKLLLIEYGPIIFLLPLIIYIILKRGDKILNILLLSGLIYLLIPLFISYPIREHELTKFTGQGLVMISLLFGLSLFFFFNSWRGKISASIKGLILIPIFLMLTQGLALNTYEVVHSFRHPKAFNNWQSFDEVIGDEVVHFEKLDWQMFNTFIDKDFNHQKIYDICPKRGATVFRTFAPGEIPLNFLSLYHNAEKIKNHNSKIKNLQQDFSLPNLKELNINYVYYTPQLEYYLNEDQKALIKGEHFHLVKRLGEGDDFRQLLEVNY